jgi:hypothetical protein
MKSGTLTCIATMTLFAALAAPLQLAAANPIPLINLPLRPDAIAPGGAGFKLTVNGTGFVSSSVVHWNGKPRTTHFVNGSRVTATVFATDIAKAATASVTVVNPSPGGGVSNVAFFDVIPPVAAIYLGTQTTYPAGSNPASMASADFNGDGKLDLAVANHGSNTVSVLLGNGDGTFLARVDYPTGAGPAGVGAADFNHDGKLDLAVSNSVDSTVSILLGNGDGTFLPHVDYSTGVGPNAIAAGDFNGDGNLDLAVVCSDGVSVYTVSVLLGNGDGTLQTHADYPTGKGPLSVAVGDFNRDGKLDLVVGNYGGNTVSVLLGLGDGTFQGRVDYATDPYPRSVSVGDLNRDGKLDLALVSGGAYPRPRLNILLGNGDGTFQAHVDYATTTNPDWMELGDFNGDGALDLAVANIYDNTVSMILGNGDGTFQPRIDYPTGVNPDALVVGDFTGDGRLGVAVANSTDNTVSVLLRAVSLSSANLPFGVQVAGTGSGPQTTTLTNSGPAPLNISSIVVTGTNASDFTQTNTCGTSVLPGASCTITVTFTPTQMGPRTASVTITDDAPGSPRSVSLSGIGVTSGPNVTLSTNSLTFALQLVGTASAPQIVTLSNYGAVSLNIASITLSGDYAESNNCGSSLAAGASCTISVTFTPSGRYRRTGTLSLTDNAPGSPQIVSLTGGGTVVALSPPNSMYFYGPDCPLSGGGWPDHICTEYLTLTNVGGDALSITSIAINPLYPRPPFSESNNCGSSVGPGKSCTITVKSYWNGTCGHACNGTVQITDDGGGSPQVVKLQLAP